MEAGTELTVSKSGMPIFRIFSEFRIFWQGERFSENFGKKIVFRIFFFFRYPRSHIYTCSKNLFPNFFSRFFRVFWLYFVLPAPNIYVTGLSFFGLFSSMLDFFRVFRLYLSFRQLPMYTSLDSQQSDNFVGHLDSDFNYFGNFPIMKFSHEKCCETEERGLRYDLSLSHLKVAIIVFWSCIANAKKKLLIFQVQKIVANMGF